jgi:hypothetical protein
MKVVPAELHFLYKCHKGWTEGISFKEGGSGTINTVSLRVWK